LRKSKQEKDKRKKEVIIREKLKGLKRDFKANIELSRERKRKRKEKK